MKGLEAKLREWGEDPGEVVSGDFTRIELHAAFDRVKNKNNWKKPISRRVRLSAREAQATAEAISFFAGSPSEIEELSDGSYRVTAPGYYVCVGA